MALQGLAVAAPKLYNPYASTGQSLGVALGTGLTSALLAYQARKQADEENMAMQPLILQALSAKNPEDVFKVTSAPGGSKLRDFALQTYLSKLEKQQAQEEAKQEVNRQIELAGIKENLYSPRVREVLGIKEDVGTLPATPTPTQESLFPGETLDEKRDKYIKQNIKIGMTPNKASEDADKRLRNETQSNKSVETKIQETRGKASIVSNLAAIASEGVAGAGSTGGPALYAGGRELASSLYQYLPTEGGRQEAQQRASSRVLDSIRPEIVKAGRSPGAVTDFENKLLIGAGPASDKTPEENKALIKGMEQRAQLDSDYADFLETYLNQKGTSVGADKLWNDYKKSEAFPGGRYNPDRASWQEYLEAKRGIIMPIESNSEEAEKAALIAEINALNAAKQGK
jgi:hypothetical protein